MQYTNLGLADDFDLFPSANQYHTIIPVKNINIISDVRCPLLYFVFVLSELRMRARKISFSSLIWKLVNVQNWYNIQVVMQILAILQFVLKFRL